jgi:hypothetical protein
MTSPQQLPPADDLYLAAHDGIGGRALLSPHLLGIGLGAALIGELMFWGRVRVTDSDTLHVVDRQPTGEGAGDAVLQRLPATPGPLGLRQCILNLAAGPANDLVERRLLAEGVLKRETKRRLLSANVSLVFADPRSPGQPAIRLRTHLSYNQSLDMPDLLLAGLFLATGLDELVFGTLNPRDRARLSDQFRRNLPQQLSDLISGTRAAATVGV